MAVNGRRNASLNPNAVMREPITIADHQSSRWIVDPLHLLDCCLISDGGVALIVTSRERARDARAGAVDILGMGQGHALQTLERKDWWYLPHQQDCISRAYRQAGLSPADIDVAQLYDNFTISVLFWLEHGGFVKPGESGPFVEGGKRIALDGELPVNTAGGNLSESYMQGWLHVVEGVRQMRGERPAAGRRRADLPCHRPRHDTANRELPDPGGIIMTKDNSTKDNATKDNATKDNATKDNATTGPGPAGSAGHRADRAVLGRGPVRRAASTAVRELRPHPLPDLHHLPVCWSADCDWTPLSGRGTVQSHIVFERAYHEAWADQVPYVVALIELDEGPVLVSNVVGVQPSAVRVGQQVTVTFGRRSATAALPQFTPVDGGGSGDGEAAR